MGEANVFDVLGVIVVCLMLGAPLVATLLPDIWERFFSKKDAAVQE